MPKIHRFPRYPDGYMERYNPPDQPMSKRMSMRVERQREGKLKRGYDILHKWQKKLIRKVINGQSVRSACKDMDIDRNTFYAYMREHPKFKQYYIAYARIAASTVDARLDAKLNRAIDVVEDALDNPDIYLATDTANKLLSGRGYYKKNVESKSQVSNQIHADVNVKHEGKPLDMEMVKAFVEVMTGKAVGGRQIKRPDVIDVKVLKELPEPPADGKSS